ncbi:hypothetical protein [Aliikangiella coralliicola]|uniref:hypothetical protein n=1 Tax=Aliikangiella coralliicola TaxID=2592383 RepID=UPI00143D8250|nr:hypothetical protein [Aliikangiella coralliicola]
MFELDLARTHRLYPESLNQLVVAIKHAYHLGYRWRLSLRLPYLPQLSACPPH